MKLADLIKQAEHKSHVRALVENAHNMCNPRDKSDLVDAKRAEREAWAQVAHKRACIAEAIENKRLELSFSY